MNYLNLLVLCIKKENLFVNFMEDLSLYEKSFKEIIPSHREHFLHSASVYVLGLSIYNSCRPVREALTISRHDNKDLHNQKSSFLFRWALTACLHDIAYPLELSLKSFRNYSSKFQKEGEEHNFLRIKEEIYKDLNLLPIVKPQKELEHIQKDTAIGLIVNRLTNYKLLDKKPTITYNTLLEIMIRYIDNLLQSGRIDHGIFSSLVTLKLVHELYRKNPDYNIKHFYYEMVDSSTAIFLHNSYKYSQLKQIYGDGEYLYDFPSPLGYLLCLSDTMCEWLRDNDDKPTDDSNLFGIAFNNNKINFKIPVDQYKKLKKDLNLFDKRIVINLKN